MNYFVDFIDEFETMFHIVFQDQKGNQLYLGVNFNGIQTFQGSRKTFQYKWNEVQKINYEGKMFIVHLVYVEVSISIIKCPFYV